MALDKNRKFAVEARNCLMNLSGNDDDKIVEISDFSEQGEGIGKKEGWVWFVPGTVPGDVCKVRKIRKKKNHHLGKVLEWVRQSEYRKNSECVHFHYCGGCAFQHTRYEFQLEWKRKRVEEIFRRMTTLSSLPDVPPVIPSEKIYGYRNKMDFSFSDRAWIPDDVYLAQRTPECSPALGFHVRGHFDKVLSLQQCLLQAHPSDAIRAFVFRFFHERKIPFFNNRRQQGVPRTLIIRNNRQGDFLVIVALYENLPELIQELGRELMQTFPAVRGVVGYHNPKGNDTLYDLNPTVIIGNAFHSETLGGLVFRYGPLSFFQINVEVAEKIFEKSLALADLKGQEVVWDLYCGTGVISLLFARKASVVWGIESLEESVRYARINAEWNRITNAHFTVGDVGTALKGLTKTSPHLLVCDPPRSGMDKKVIAFLLHAEPEKIIYISCNPATQARDLEMLSEKYHLSFLQPFDMFPQTPHIENLCVLEKKKSSYGV